MDIFRLDEESGLWERGEELHRERSYEPQELVEYLTQAGFQDIRQYGNLKMRSPKPERTASSLPPEKIPS